MNDLCDKSEWLIKTFLKDPTVKENQFDPKQFLFSHPFMTGYTLTSPFFLCISSFYVYLHLQLYLFFFIFHEHLPLPIASLCFLSTSISIFFLSVCALTLVFSVSKTIPSFLSTSHTLLDFIRYYIPILHHHQLYPRLRLFMQQVRRQLVSLRNHPTNEPDSFTVVDLVPTFFFSTPPLSSSLSLIHPLTRTIQKRYAPFLSHFYPRR